MRASLFLVPPPAQVDKRQRKNKTLRTIDVRVSLYFSDEGAEGW